MFEKVKWPGRYRRYVLECVEGELVFRQPEIDAAIEAAIAALPDFGRLAYWQAYYQNVLAEAGKGVVNTKVLPWRPFPLLGGKVRATAPAVLHKRGWFAQARQP